MEKRVSFEDRVPEDSDEEDNSAVEVVFDAANPYRRKSSLVSSDSVHPRLRRQPRQRQQDTPLPEPTECLVHQFLASHRHHHLHHDHHGRPQIKSKASIHAQDISEEAGLNHPIDPKGASLISESCDGANESIPSSSGSQSRTLISGLSAEESFSSSSSSNEQINSWLSKRTPSQLDLASATSPEINSRLLTKRQLSEMAWGVREFSRKLGSMRLRLRVKTIFLLTKIYDAQLIQHTRELSKWLLDDAEHKDAKYTVYVDKDLKDSKKFDAKSIVEGVEDGEKRLRYWDEEMCRVRPHTFDFVITLGGDGTVLYASWLFQRIVPPVLSFALGSLGFLTKFDYQDFRETLSGMFSEGVTLSLRLRFEVTVMRSRKKGITADGLDAVEEDEEQRDLVEELVGEEKDDEHTHQPDVTYEVLNEVVVDRGPNTTMSYISIFGDDEHFTSVLADGICVSTPTGSTAYNLAAGGSLCHPDNPVMLVTAICAHTLSFRPIIVPDTIVLRIGVPYDARTGSWASFDGRERVELKPGDYVTISASRYPFACVLPPGRRSDWINSISAKLGWNTRQRQKPLKEWEKESQ
ncbi:NAD(+) kinase [Podospora fimiseda]|uniref:NAD(+) kinase n=1 Tax=Podospora fimiseda TaxID=252190 RepID=A0AAN7BP54_9PEZI|nr:NAD(+) kinase [Podospora fimiseda]